MPRVLETCDTNLVMNTHRLLIQVLALNGAIVTGVLRPLELGNPALGVIYPPDQCAVTVLRVDSLVRVRFPDGEEHAVRKEALRSFELVETLELGPIPALSAEELATTLAGLRLVQRECGHGFGDSIADILTSDGATAEGDCDLLLLDGEIDALISRLNSDDGRASLTREQTEALDLGGLALQRVVGDRQFMRDNNLTDETAQRLSETLFAMKD